MTLKEWCERLDKGDWNNLHRAFFDQLRPDVLKSAWGAMVEYAGALVFSAGQPGDMLAATLPAEPEPPPLSTWAWVSAALVRLGVPPSEVEGVAAETGLALLCESK